MMLREKIYVPVCPADLYGNGDANSWIVKEIY